MAFALTLLYISVSLLSPDALPEAFQDIHILEIVAALIFFSSLPNLQGSRFAALKDTWFITAILFAVFFSIVATGWIGGAFAVLAGFLPVIAAFYFLVINCSNLTQLKILSFALFLVMVNVLVHAWIDDHSGVFPSRYIYLAGTVPRYRGLGVINDPNDLAQVLVATTALLFLRWKKGAFTANLFLTLLPAAFLCFGVYMTHSRGGLLALVVMILYGLKDRLGVVRSVILTGLFAGALILFNATGGRNMNDDDGDRIGLWSTALTTFKTHPISGVGVNRFGDYSGNGLTAHNSYVLCLAELGLVGYVPWMGAIVTTWSALGVISGRKPEAEKEPVDDPPATPPLAGGETADASVRLPAAVGVLSQPQTLRPPRGRLTLEPTYKHDLEALRSASSVLRTAMIGVLVSAFFISRTYALILYVVFGMAAALQVMYLRQTGQETLKLRVFKRVCAVTVASVLFIYIFVRIKSHSG